MTTDLREFRQGFIGRSNGVHEPVGSLHSPLAEAIVTKLSAVNPRKAREVALYFAEMYACFTEWRRVIPIAEPEFTKTAVDDPLLKVPPASRGNLACSVPLAKRGEPAGGGQL